MKVLMLLERDYPPDTRVENEIRSLVNDNVEVSIACFTFKDRPLVEKINGYTIYRKRISKLRNKTSVGALRLPFYFSFWRKFVMDIMAKEHFDAIHIHDLPLSIIGVEAKKAFGVKLILDLHENWPAALQIALHTKTMLGRLLSSDAQWRKYERKVLQEADLIITVIEEAEQRVVNLGIPSGKVIIVPNTLEEDTFVVSDRNPDLEKVTLFYAGGVNVHRGLQIVIRGLPDVIKEIPNVRVWIIGPGSYLDTLKQLVNEFDLTEHVKFFGWKDLQEIAELIAESDITLIPHLKSEHTDHTAPHKLYQYMYAGKPILASNCDPIERIVNENNVGVIYKHNEPNEFAAALVKMVKTLGNTDYENNGKQAAKKKYLWNDTVGDLLTAYKRFEN